MSIAGVVWNIFLWGFHGCFGDVCQEHVLILEDNDLRHAPVETMEKVWEFTGLSPMNVSNISSKDVYNK
jgi:hypothetical protein